MSSDEDDAPPCEVVKKTKAEYDATLAKLGVAKVCEKKYRPTGSEEPFTLCETTTGLAKNSTCRTCQGERQGKNHKRGPSQQTGRNNCPCKEHGGSCTHGRGHKAAGYRCAKCRDGKCTPEYHASGMHWGDDGRGKTGRNRNNCPCKEHGGGCTHGRGHKAAGYRCATCRDGKCDASHHQTGSNALNAVAEQVLRLR